MMASSSDTFSSALSYALELLGMPSLTLNEKQWKSLEAVYQGILCSYAEYRQNLAGAFATKLHDRVQERALC